MPSPWLVVALLLFGISSYHHVDAIKCYGEHSDIDTENVKKIECSQCYIDYDEENNKKHAGCVPPVAGTDNYWLSLTQQTPDACIGRHEASFNQYVGLQRRKICSTDFCNVRCGEVKPIKCLSSFEDSMFYYLPTNKTATHYRMRKVVEPYVREDCRACVRYQNDFGWIFGSSAFPNGAVTKDKVFYDCLVNENLDGVFKHRLFSRDVHLHDCKVMQVDNFEVSFYMCNNKDFCNAWCGAASVSMTQLMMGIVGAIGVLLMRR